MLKSPLVSLDEWFTSDPQLGSSDRYGSLASQRRGLSSLRCFGSSVDPQTMVHHSEPTASCGSNQRGRHIIISVQLF